MYYKSKYFKPSPMHEENRIIEEAFSILSARLREATISLTSLHLAETYLLHKLILEEREIFGALWLDVKNRLIASEDLAMGTITKVQISPREVLKSALRHNAANVILFHNHPTGDVTPSESDKLMTANLKRLLDMIDVKLHDHIIVSGEQTRSFAAHGDL